MTQSLTFDIFIEHPRDDTNEYVYDESAHAVRLAGVTRVSALALADRGSVVGSATPLGEPLPAWLLSDLPLSPNTVVAARAVGALEYAQREPIERIVVAVPVADPQYARVYAFNDLPGPHRAALQRLIEDSARWHDAAFAEEMVHLARQRARLAQVEQRNRERDRPAWHAGSEFNYVEQLARETALHTQAEAALFTVPYRFQSYLRLCLESNERIIFWVFRPRFAISRIARMGGKKFRDGLLVITDQQCLWMVDPVTSTVAVEGGYGYTARTIPLEWVTDAALEEKSDYVALRVVSVNRVGARSDFQIEFPPAARSDLAQVVRLLCAFAPRPDDRRLRRIGSPQPAKIQLDDPMERDHAQTAAVVEELQTALAAQLNGETIFAQAFLPSWSEGGAKLLTITDHRIILTASRARQPIVLDLDNFVAAEICYSVLGSWFRIESSDAKPLEIPLPITTFKGFNACWRMLRRLGIRAYTSRAMPQPSSSE
jgi:inorganic pyrophosphatase